MRGAFKLISAALLLALLLGILLGPSGWQAWPSGVESFGAIVNALFGKYLLAFEILSVLLLAALIGAVYMARRGSP